MDIDDFERTANVPVPMNNAAPDAAAAFSKARAKDFDAFPKTGDGFGSAFPKSGDAKRIFDMFYNTANDPELYKDHEAAGRPGPSKRARMDGSVQADAACPSLSDNGVDLQDEDSHIFDDLFHAPADASHHSRLFTDPSDNDYDDEDEEAQEIPHTFNQPRNPRPRKPARAGVCVDFDTAENKMERTIQFQPCDMSNYAYMTGQKIKESPREVAKLKAFQEQLRSSSAFKKSGTKTSASAFQKSGTKTPASPNGEAARGGSAGGSEVTASQVSLNDGEFARFFSKRVADLDSLDEQSATSSSSFLKRNAGGLGGVFPPHNHESAGAPPGGVGASPPRGMGGSAPHPPRCRLCRYTSVPSMYSDKHILNAHQRMVRYDLEKCGFIPDVILFKEMRDVFNEEQAFLAKESGRSFMITTAEVATHFLHHDLTNPIRRIQTQLRWCEELFARGQRYTFGIVDGQEFMNTNKINQMLRISKHHQELVRTFMTLRTTVTHQIREANSARDAAAGGGVAALIGGATGADGNNNHASAAQRRKSRHLNGAAASGRHHCDFLM